MKFDQQSIEQRIETSLRSKSEWADLLFFGTNKRLISIIAEANAQTARYAEYIGRETIWSLARNRSSLLYQSSAHNYNPRRKVGAVGEIRVGVSEDFTTIPSVTVDLPKYTVFTSDAGIKVTSINTNNIVQNLDSFVDIQVVQGEPKTFSTTALGDINEVIEIDNGSIEDVYYELFVNGELWEEVDELRVYDGTDKVYQIRNKPDFSGIELVFGNNLNGLQLSAGDTIRFRYIETLGSNGNITQTGKINSADSVIYNANNEIVDVTVTNLSPITGGEDEEDIELIRSLSPLSFQAAERAITSKDYKSILDSTPQVANSTVWGVYEINEDAGTPGLYRPDEENFVNVAAISSSGENLTSLEKEALREYLLDFKSPTDVINFQDVEFLYLVFNTNIFVSNRSLVLSEVKSRVINSLLSEFSKDNLDFGDDIPESDYQAFIDNISGVDYHNTVVELAKFIDFNTAQYEAGVVLPLATIKASTVSIFVKHKTEQTDTEWQLVAVDDGSGGLDDSVGDFIINPIGSEMNYLTGEFAITITSGLPLDEYYASDFEDYELKIEYQISEDNFVPQFRYQIFDIYQANVTIQYT